MSEKTERQTTEMKKQTIGVEVEMNNITRQKAAKVAADYFGTGRYESTAHRNGYSTWSAWDSQNREWKFSKDVSIAGPDEEKCEQTERRFGKIVSKTVLYRGEEFKTEDGILYLNAEKYLKELSDEFSFNLKNQQGR